MPEDGNETALKFNKLTLYKYRQTPCAVNISYTK
jgi:hypothetical protein